MLKGLNIGSMDRRVTITSPGDVTVDSEGMPVDSFVNLYTNVPAKRVYQKGSEKEEAGQPTVSQSVMFTLRYVSNINADCQIVDDGVLYQVRSTQEIGRRQGLLVYAESVSSAMDGEAIAVDPTPMPDPDPTPDPTPDNNLILDDITGAGVAYTLRRLLISQTLAIRVRRSRDDEERDIGFIGNDLDTVTLLDFVGNGVGYIPVWYDPTGGGNDAVMTDANKQLIIASGGAVNMVNGKPALQGNVANLRHLVSSYSLPTTQTYFVVGELPVSGSSFLFGTYQSGANYRQYVASDNTGVHRSAYGSSSFIRSSAALGSQALLTGVMDGATFTGYSNGSAMYTETPSTVGNASSSFGFSILALGNSGATQTNTGTDGYIQELIVYPVAQSDENVAAVETDINDYYSIF